MPPATVTSGTKSFTNTSSAPAVVGSLSVIAPASVPETLAGRNGVVTVKLLLYGEAGPPADCTETTGWSGPSVVAAAFSRTNGLPQPSRRRAKPGGCGGNCK